MNKIKKIILSLIVSLSFTSNSAQQNACQHTFNMYDSYGDGWNGGAGVDVVVNGVTVITGATLPSGGFGSLPFSAGSGDLIELANWNGGSWPGEITWDVTDCF